MSSALAVHEVGGEFVDIATRGPIEGLLVLIGGLLIAFALGAFGALTLAGLLAALRRPSG